MPIRDHIPLLHKVMGYFRLTSSELQALHDFNTALDAVIMTRIALQFMHSHPLFKPTPETIHAAKEHPTLRKSNWANFKLTLPESINALNGPSLIKLALHPEGEYFYKYLNDVLCHEMLQLINQSQQYPEEIPTISELNTLLNSLATVELKPCPLSTNTLFNKIRQIFKDDFTLSEETLFFTDGLPLEFIGSTYISNVLRATRDDYKKRAKEIPRTLQQELNALQLIASSHGSFAEAHRFTLSLAAQLYKSPSLAEATKLYDIFYANFFTPHLLPRYQALGQLLLVMLHQALLRFGSSCYLKKELSFAEYIGRDDHIQVMLYQSLESAKQQEAHCKNILRLALTQDNCNSYIALLFPNGCMQQSTAFDSIAQLQGFLRQRYQHLCTAFDNNLNGKFASKTLATTPTLPQP